LRRQVRRYGVEQIEFVSDGNSPIDMDYYGHALLTQKAGWTSGELGDGSDEEESVGINTMFTKTDFEKALKKVSRKVKR
jgi:hypothetical protein